MASQLKILEYKSIICPGFTCVLHVHSVVEDVTITHLLALADKEGQQPKNFPTCRISALSPRIPDEFPGLCRSVFVGSGLTWRCV